MYRSKPKKKRSKKGADDRRFSRTGVVFPLLCNEQNWTFTWISCRQSSTAGKKWSFWCVVRWICVNMSTPPGYMAIMKHTLPILTSEDSRQLCLGRPRSLSY